jgi:hypothetical protein
MAKTHMLVVGTTGHALALNVVRTGLDFNDRAEALKQEAKDKLDALKDEWEVVHRDNWNALCGELGLDPDGDYSVDQNYLEDHNVLFVLENEPKLSGPPEGLAQALAQALANGGAQGGVISVGRD